jgi:hypothetical protein
MSSKVLIITGMHRSGTSLLSQYLSQCGLHIGKELINFDTINSQSAYNGHHEDRDFLEFHREIMARVRIYGFPTNELQLLLFRINSSDRQKAIKLIKSRENLAQWGWKDPRTTLFLDFWHELIVSPKYLFVYREPLLVVDSLLRRGTDKHILKKPIIALRSWKIYNRQIIKFWYKHKDICVLYNIADLATNYNCTIDHLNSKLGTELQQTDLSKIYRKNALKQQLSEASETIKLKYPKEVAESMEIYRELEYLSKNESFYN